MRLLGLLLIIVAILAVIAGVIYLVEPAKSLPSFFPGHAAGVTGHHNKRGIAGIVVGVILFAVGLVASSRPRRAVY